MQKQGSEVLYLKKMKRPMRFCAGKPQESAWERLNEQETWQDRNGFSREEPDC